MTAKRWPSSIEAKRAGWFSTRHRTNAAHLAAQAAWRAKQEAKGTCYGPGKCRGSHLIIPADPPSGGPGGTDPVLSGPGSVPSLRGGQ